MGYNNDFIPDGMNAFERNVKRIGDCIVAAVLMIVFSPFIFDLLYSCETGRWWGSYI